MSCVDWNNTKFEQDLERQLERRHLVQSTHLRTNDSILNLNSKCYDQFLLMGPVPSSSKDLHASSDTKLSSMLHELKESQLRSDEKIEQVILVAYPPILLPYVDYNTVIRLSFPTGGDGKYLKNNGIEPLQDEFCFTLGIGEDEIIYGTCVHVSLIKSPTPFFAKSFNKESLYAFVMLSHAPILAAHFSFLSFLALNVLHHFEFADLPDVFPELFQTDHLMSQFDEDIDEKHPDIALRSTRSNNTQAARYPSHIAISRKSATTISIPSDFPFTSIKNTEFQQVTENPNERYRRASTNFILSELITNKANQQPVKTVNNDDFIFHIPAVSDPTISSPNEPNIHMQSIRSIVIDGIFAHNIMIKKIPEEFQRILRYYYTLTISSPPFLIGKNSCMFFPPAKSIIDHDCLLWLSLDTLFSLLEPDTIINLISLLILDAQVLIIGSSLQEVTMTVIALQQLIKPFDFSGLVIPILSNSPEFLSLLESPTPFLIGVPPTPDLDSFEFLDTAIFVNLDKKVTSMTIEVSYPNFKNVVKKLTKILRKEKICKASHPFAFPDIFKDYLNHRYSFSPETCNSILACIQEPLKILHSDEIFGYFVTEMNTKANESTGRVTIFNTELFLASVQKQDRQYFRQLLESQTFQMFIENRIWDYLVLIKGQQANGMNMTTNISLGLRENFRPKTRRRSKSIQKTFPIEKH